jgi:putative DNA primase/helicase
VRAGACATGIATETLDIDYGHGGNGKSKFHGAVQHVLGPYAVVPNKSLLVEEKNEQHATVLATLFRARLGVAGELEKRMALNEATVKNITGADRIGCRRMREDEWFFSPTHTLILFSNHKPIIKGTDESIRRRIRLVPWEVTIPEAERDAELLEKLKAEAPIILNWIIEGARLFFEAGCKVPVPESVRVATEDYLDDENWAGKFVGESLTFNNPVARLSTAKIIELAEEWMADQGVKWTLNIKDIAAVLEDRGATNIGRVRNELGRKETTWQGVGTANSGSSG